MAQQTAVEWLEDVYNTQGHILPSQFEQAKQMEKKQSKKDYYAGLEGYIVNDGGFEQYYNETYGNNQNK